MRLHDVLWPILLGILTTILSLVYFHKQKFIHFAIESNFDFDYVKSVSRHNSTALFDSNQTRSIKFASGEQSESTANSSSSEIQDSNSLCFPHNTQQWLGSKKRLGNSNDSSIDHAFVTHTILNLEKNLDHDGANFFQPFLQQTLCHKSSRFLTLNMSKDELQNPSNATISFWSSRLIYLATHIHQHAPALQEARERLKHASCTMEMDSRGIGNFDFECPSSKFLVVSMGRLGLGAVMRLGAVNALMAGISTNRTVVFVNNSPVGPKFIQEPWLLASCPRRDLQCFYMPPTPCVLTQEQLVNATVLQKGDRRALFKTGILPEDIADERVLILDVVLRPQREPLTFRKNLESLIQTYIIDPLTKRHPTDPLIPVLNKATNHILEPEILVDGTYYYHGHNSKHNRALVFYAMRPNIHNTRKLDYIMQETIPENFDPNLSLGLPIRASDKCLQESECLSFNQYMDLMGHTWTKYEEELIVSRHHVAMKKKVHQSRMKASIIITSEANDIYKSQKIYQDQGSQVNISFPYQFINNRFDIQQGTGNPNKIKDISENITLDDLMLSSISSLKVQLYARYSFGNCCSNFHLLLFDFLRGGCGAAEEQVAECLQDNADPVFRLCCQWSKSDECHAKREISAKLL